MEWYTAVKRNELGLYCVTWLLSKIMLSEKKNQDPDETYHIITFM